MVLIMAIVPVMMSECSITVTTEGTIASMPTTIMMLSSTVMVMHIVNGVHAVTTVRRNIAGDDHAGTRQNNANLERN